MTSEQIILLPFMIPAVLGIFVMISIMLGGEDWFDDEDCDEDYDQWYSETGGIEVPAQEE